MSHRHPTAHGDSAGVPWAGRNLNPTPFSGDTGEVPEEVASALLAYAQDPQALAGVVTALAPQRVMVAVVATETETVQGEHGLIDAQADMSLVTLTGRDGTRALPVFSGTDALARWDAAARPVPVEAARAAQAAVVQECDVLVLDPAGPVSVLIPRPAVWAIAQGRTWVPSPHDPEVVSAVTHLAGSIQGIAAVVCRPGAPGTAAELEVVLTLVPGLDAAAVQAVLGEVGAALGADQLVAERVASVRLVAAS